MQNVIFLILYLFLVRGNTAPGGPVRICGVSLSYQQSSIFICNDSTGEMDLSGFLLSVNKKPREKFSFRLADKTTVSGESDIEIPIPFLDIPYNILGGNKFNRFYLFDKENNLVSEFKSRNRE